MTMMLYICRQRQFQWTWFGVHRPSGCGFVVAARFQEPLSHPWACPLCPHGQMTMMTMMLHIYRAKQFQWTWFGVNRPSGCGFAWWPWCCTSTGQSSSNELDLEWIGPVVADLPHTQNSRSPYHTHGEAYYAPMGKWLWRCTCTSQDGSKTFIWNELAQWLLSSGVGKIPETLISYYRFQEPLLHPWACPCGPMGKWPWCSTSRA